MVHIHVTMWEILYTVERNIRPERVNRDDANTKRAFFPRILFDDMCCTQPPPAPVKSRKCHCKRRYDVTNGIEKEKRFFSFVAFCFPLVLKNAYS